MLSVQEDSKFKKPSSSYWVGRPATIGEGFVGCEPRLQAIDDAFKSLKKVVVISGGAGTGKSRLAAEFSHRSGVPGFWTTAGGNCVQILTALAQSIDVPAGEATDEEIAVAVQRRLSDLSSETLWIVDNLDDLNQINELATAAGPVRLLITTRDARHHLLPPNAAFLEAYPLSQYPSIMLLCSRSKHDAGDPSLSEIARQVGGLPIALEMLAVRLGEPRQTPKRLLNKLKNAPTVIELGAFQQIPGATIPRAEGVFTTIVGMLNRLPSEARQRLSPLGYVADAPVPYQLFAALTGLEEEELERLILECHRHSILALVDEKVVVHALTISAMNATNEEGILEYTISHANQALSRTSLAGLRLEIVHYERILQHARDVLGTEDICGLELASGLAICYRELGRYQEAAELDEETRRIRERVLGPEHPHTLTSRNNLAVDYRELGRYQEAVELDEETLKISERVLGPEHPDTLTSRNNLAVDYRELGRYQEAVQLNEETLRIRERVLGRDHPHTLTSRSNLEALYKDKPKNIERGWIRKLFSLLFRQGRGLPISMTNSMRVKYHPPICPACDHELASVWERKEFTFYFNEARGFYEAASAPDLMEAKCSNCKANVSQLFEEGVDKYSNKGRVHTNSNDLNP